MILLYRQGENYFLQSIIPDYTEASRTVFSRDLGKNVLIASDGLVFENGRMTVEYQDRNETWHKAEVPFGDFYGDKHISQEKPIKELPAESHSKKYGAAGVLKREEVIVENFLATLQKNIRDDDMDAISKMLIYPIMAGSVWLENRHDFLKYHPQIFTEKVKQELLQLQNKDILCDCRGMMINNRMWFGIRDNGKAYFYAIRGNSQTHSERD